MNRRGQKYYRRFPNNDLLIGYSMKTPMNHLFLLFYECDTACIAAFSHGLLIYRRVTFFHVLRPTKKSASYKTAEKEY